METLDGIRFNEPATFFCHPAHDDEQQQPLREQHRYRAVATAAAALSMYVVLVQQYNAGCIRFYSIRGTRL